MSLLKKLIKGENFFRQKKRKKEESEKRMGETMERTHGRRYLRNQLTQNQVNDWARERETELRMLRDWLQKEPHLPQNVTDQQILTFLWGSENSVEKTKTLIDNYFTIRTHTPEIFSSRSIRSKEIIRAFEALKIAPFIGIPSIQDNFIFVEFLHIEGEKIDFVSVLKAGNLILDALARYYPTEENLSIVFSAKFPVIAQILRTNIIVLKKMLFYSQSCILGRLDRIHVINANPMVNQLLMLLKPFMNMELRRLIHIHTQDSMESFYKFISRKSMPKEYGGEGPSIEEVQDELMDILKEQESYLQALELLVVNESRRAGKPKTTNEIFGVEGSFRRLEID